MDRGRQACGFTLLELVVVMGIAALITLASVPSFLGFTRTARLRSSASDISSALASARRFAITRNTSYAVAIYGNDYGNEDLKNSFQYWEASDSQLPERKLLHQTVKITEPTGADEKVFTFSSRGSVSPGGTIELEDAAGKKVVITVHPTTGRARTSEIIEP